jgi:hypothetical protein
MALRYDFVLVTVAIFLFSLNAFAQASVAIVEEVDSKSAGDEFMACLTVGSDDPPSVAHLTDDSQIAAVAAPKNPTLPKLIGSCAPKLPLTAVTAGHGDRLAGITRP